jgi:hypothetical protein
MASGALCEHTQSIHHLQFPRHAECEECMKTGDARVHLRASQTCSVTLCCDSSPNRHASRHANISGHPVVCSAEPGERWLYCFPDRMTVNY